jgi:ribonuclease VapC
LIVDTSALIAILRGEPDADALAGLLAAAEEPWMSAGTYLEAAVVVDAARDPVLSRRFDDLVAEAGIRVEPWTQDQAEIGRQAYRDFGKGSGHPAQLNLGDCFAYSLARQTGRPLLFKGDDFTHTDIRPSATK